MAINSYGAHALRCRAVMACVALLMLGGCGGEAEPGTGGDLDAYAPINIGGDGDPYDPERLLEVNVTMAEEDLAVLRREGRTLASVAARDCIDEFDYTRFPATVEIDGDVMENVNVRKKGFLGSLTINRPSLVLYFDDLVKGRRYQGLERMTLNNNRQDQSGVRSCMAFDLFREAGLVAPRCNYARVTLNGEELGTYAHLEAMQEPLLRDAYGRPDGSHYESQTADFGRYLSRRFEKKNFNRANDRSDLRAIDDVVELGDEALAQGDAEGLETFETLLAQHVDVDQFIAFWAMEALLGFWDGAAGNANNFHIYRNPQDGRFQFIPWGPDTAFTRGHQLRPGTGPIFRNFSLAELLYAIPERRAQFEQTLTTYLDEIWDESALLAELERVRDMTGITQAEQSQVINIINTQRSFLETELARENPSGSPSRLKNVPPECSGLSTTTLSGTVSSDAPHGSFSFTLPDGQAMTAGLDGIPEDVGPFMLSVNEETNPDGISLLVLGFKLSPVKIYAVQVFMDRPQFTPGTHELHGFATNTILVEVDPVTQGFEILAFGDTGTLTLSGNVAEYLDSGGASGDFTLTFDALLKYDETTQQ